MTVSSVDQGWARKMSVRTHAELGYRYAASRGYATYRPCSDSGPTVSPLPAQISASAGRAANVAFQLPGADVQSESWRSTVAPGTSVEEMSSTIEPGVASRRQSRPQVVHSTGARRACRAAMRVEADKAP